MFISNHLPNDSGEKSMLPHRPAGFWLPMTFAGAAVLVLSAYVSLYRDIQLDIVLVVVLFSCGSYAFWQTRDRGWRSVCTVGGVVATLLLLDVILFFPHLPDQVFRACGEGNCRRSSPLSATGGRVRVLYHAQHACGFGCPPCVETPTDCV